MAKKYAFRFTIQKAEFSSGSVSVAYGAGCTSSEAHKEMTFTEAQQFLKEFSAQHPAPHCAFLTMQYRSDRVPPGWKAAPNRVDRKD